MKAEEEAAMKAEEEAAMKAEEEAEEEAAMKAEEEAAMKAEEAKKQAYLTLPWAKLKGNSQAGSPPGLA